MSITVTVAVTKGDRYWVGLPEGYPGSCMGRTIAELMDEAQAGLPFMVAGPDGVPVRDLVIEYVFTDIPVDLRDEVRRYRELVIQRREIYRTLNELCLLYTSPSPRDGLLSRMPSSA